MSRIQMKVNVDIPEKISIFALSKMSPIKFSAMQTKTATDPLI